jgi:hypothetical protein
MEVTLSTFQLPISSVRLLESRKVLSIFFTLAVFQVLRPIPENKVASRNVDANP